MSPSGAVQLDSMTALGQEAPSEPGTKRMIVPLAGEVLENLAREIERRSVQCGNSHNCVVLSNAGPSERKSIKCHCGAENGTKRARYQRISVNISRLSRCYGRPSVVRNRGLARQTPIASLFFRCINSEGGGRLRQRGSPSKATRYMVVMPGCRRTIRGTIMSFAIQHVHVKTKDPKQQ